MPYIRPEQRPALDRAAQAAVPEDAGELNYLITRIVDGFIAHAGPIRYARLNEAIGALEAAKLELYRRLAAPYEDTKCDANGDVYTATG